MRTPVTPLRLALCLVMLVAASARAAFGPGDNLRSVQAGGLSRSYRVYAPAAVDGSTPVPLVVDIHGWRSNAAQQQALSGMQAVADANGFLVVYPEGIENAWNAGLCCGNRHIDDVGFLRTLVDAVAEEGNVDRRRVYATGLSNGGAMSQRLACDAADLFAAAAPMAFPLPFRSPSECKPSRSIPVLTVMGLTDVLVRYDGGLFPPAPDTLEYWRDVDACAGEPERVDRGQSRCETFTQCANGVQVGLCSVVARSFGGTFFDGHIVYLNDDFVLAQVAWDFLSQFTLPEDAAAAVAADLAGSDRIKLGGLPRRLTPLSFAVRLGKGTWAADGEGTALGGPWRRSKRAPRTGTAELTTDAGAALQALVARRIQELTSTSGGPQFTLEQVGPLRLRVGRTGAPTFLRGRFDILRGGVPGATIGRYDLSLRRAR